MHTLFDDQSLDMQDTCQTAQDILGKILVVETEQGVLAGRILETEAYLENDPASHTYRGRTDRNTWMFYPAGTLYIYLIYGVHHCLNIVTGPEGTGEAVLIRALEPLEGITVMQDNRQRLAVRDLCSGPGKLTQALGIDRSWSGEVLNQGRVSLESDGLHDFSIQQTPRIGISQAKDLLYRYLFIPL